MGVLKEIETAGQFAEELLAAGDKLVVVNFYASWTIPCQCKVIAPTLIDLAREYDVVALKVNVGEHKQLADEHLITRMPTFVFYLDRRLIDVRISGAAHRALQKAVRKHMPKRRRTISCSCCCAA